MAHFGATRRKALGGAAALGTTALTTPRAAQAQTKVLRARANYRYNNFDPAFKEFETEDVVEEAIYPRLIGYNGTDYGWVEQDAKIKQLDGTSVQFTLREGMGWTNGFGEVTAEDVKYSYERIADPALASAYAGDWSALDNVEVVDKLTGIIHLKTPFPPLYATTLPMAAGAVVCKKALESLPDKRYGIDVPAQCGPYMIGSYQPGQKLTLVPNPDWPGERAAFDEIHIHEVDDDKTAEIAFDSGDLDATNISVSSIPDFQNNPRENSTMIGKPALAYWWLGMMVDHPLFQDIRVRRAVQHAVDIREICEGVFFGAEPATGIICPGLLGHREMGMFGLDPDLEKAKALLAEAGVADGFKTVLTTKNSTEHTSSAQIIQAQLARIGIEVEVAPEESGALWDRSQSKDDSWKVNQMLLWRYGVAPDPSWCTEWFTPSQISQWNWERWNNGEYGRLHDAAKQELDHEKRAAMYVRMQELMDEDGAYVFITYGTNAWVHKNDLKMAFRGDCYQPLYRKCAPA
ncbi:MAG: peptide ABC transporter substrate-binding protein [Alphaproteobacteria bacterium]|nr:peptide ABC transporter substrate-binding protein [Alphaproteobacteria bacterium]